MAALAGEFRTIALDLPAHGSRAAEPFTLDAAPTAVADAIRDRRRRAGGRRRPVARRLCRDGARRARARARSAGSCCRAPPPNRSGSGCCRTWPWPAPWTASTPDVLTRLNALVLPTPLPGGHRRPDRRRRVLDARRRGGAPGPRRRAVRAAPGGLPGPDAHHQRVARPPVPALRPDVRARRPTTRAGSAWPGRRTSPTSTGRRPSPRPSAGSRGRSTRPDGARIGVPRGPAAILTGPPNPTS